jgi:hypothetical protein
MKGAYLYEGSIKEVEKLRGRNGGGRETVGILDAGRTPGYEKIRQLRKPRQTDCMRKCIS